MILSQEKVTLNVDLVNKNSTFLGNIKKKVKVFKKNVFQKSGEFRQKSGKKSLKKSVATEFFRKKK